MLRQALATSSRALHFTAKAYAKQPFVRSQFSPASLSSVRSQIPSSRWYSDQAEPAEKKEGKDTKPVVEAAENAPSDVEAELKMKLEAKEKEALDWKDKALRSVADFRNLQGRTQREMKAARDFAIQKFAKDLVDSVDNLDRALIMGQEKLKAAEAEGAEKNEDLAAFYEGVKMTEGLMLQTLTKHGLERFDPDGEKFNPNEHEATFMTPMPGKEDNTVFHVQQKGFKLNGRVLRAAKVGVVKSQ
ncbi:GrpE-domain-containing protein [Pseudomassariella vexata]|uniref:GrpE protein homolog n=1 Tax=Pseudomassariella vexata TaxID=1141098 RepID=A0A1Y2DAJ0_9PEZI|nr:GrpE-domain-containing protein [Pseudomassariella vexata]ORY56126.1 GrpE-domain-containing protein [Pseudomassariella vexata]